MKWRERISKVGLDDNEGVKVWWEGGAAHGIGSEGLHS